MVRWWETFTLCSTAVHKSPHPYHHCINHHIHIPSHPLLTLEKSLTRHFRWYGLYKHEDCITWCSIIDLFNCPIPLLRTPPYPALQVWLPGRGTTGLGLPGPLPILVSKVSCPGKLLSPRQPGQLVTLLCSHVLDHEPPLRPWLTQSMVYVFVKLDQSPSLSLGFWMLNWEKHTETRSCLQH